MYNAYSQTYKTVNTRNMTVIVLQENTNQEGVRN